MAGTGVPELQETALLFLNAREMPSFLTLFLLSGAIGSLLFWRGFSRRCLPAPLGAARRTSRRSSCAVREERLFTTGQTIILSIVIIALDWMDRVAAVSLRSDCTR
jgi:hypothetical protein